MTKCDIMTNVAANLLDYIKYGMCNTYTWKGYTICMYYQNTWDSGFHVQYQ